MGVVSSGGIGYSFEIASYAIVGVSFGVLCIVCGNRVEMNHKMVAVKGVLADQTGGAVRSEPLFGWSIPLGSGNAKEFGGLLESLGTA